MDRPFDFAEVVRTHHRRAQAILFADDPAGRKIQADHAKAIGRNRNVGLAGPQDLARLPPDGSWAMGALVGPASDLAPLAGWARKAAKDEDDRIRLYVLPRVDVAAALAPWYAAGLDDPRTADARDWRALHPSFGLFFANVVYVDAKLRPERFR